MDLDTFSYLKFFFALIFVLGLIGALAVLAKRFGIGNKGPLFNKKDNTLSIIETLQLDSKRRIVRVRRNSAEYLILLGIGTDILLDTQHSHNSENISQGSEISNINNNNKGLDISE
ncbi:flagellar biosynthetic protein FliO [Rhodospirillales bacterium]|jgi:flagellar protein FliO/FliZ|nr:flagellar biosynthetic protein FliO [Rhodospirillales bacterium]